MQGLFCDRIGLSPVELILQYSLYALLLNENAAVGRQVKTNFFQKFNTTEC